MVLTPEQEHPKTAFGWAARDSSDVLSPFQFSRRDHFFYLIPFFWGRTSALSSPAQSLSPLSLSLIVSAKSLSDCLCQILRKAGSQGRKAGSHQPKPRNPTMKSRNSTKPRNPTKVPPLLSQKSEQAQKFSDGEQGWRKEKERENRRERCLFQSSVLRDMPFGPSHGQE